MDFSFDFYFVALVAMRITGCVMFNPILGRRNIPMMLRSGLIVILTIFVCSVTPVQQVNIVGLLDFFVCVAKELLLGFIIGLIIRMFFSIVNISGEVIDMQIGLSMAKAYDSQTESQSTVTTSLLNIMYMMVFFVSNGHVTLMRVITQTAIFVPYDQLSINIGSFEQVIELFSLILLYSVKLTLPILAIELITEMGVGMLMRAVPQINVFIINLQLKVFLGLVSIWLLVPAFSAFFERMVELMFDNIQHIMGI